MLDYIPIGNECYFVTGATGFLGSYLIRDILQKYPTSSVVTVARSDATKSARERVLEAVTHILELNDDLKARIEVLEGDLRQPEMGLSESQLQNLVDRVTYVIHSAAVVQFGWGIEKFRDINVAGALNVLRFCKLIPSNRLKQVCFISTAYVCGKREGVILERELNCGQQFNNYYEQSKAEAEISIHVQSVGLPFTIVRPSIIVGDSNTGYVKSINTIYSALVLACQGRLLYAPEGMLDLVPIDYVSDATLMVLHSPAARGKTFHVVGGRDGVINWKQFVEPLLSLVHQHQSRASQMYRVVPQPVYMEVYAKRREIFLRKSSLALEQVHQTYTPYLLTGNKTFDDSNMQAVMQAYGYSKKVVKDKQTILAQFFASKILPSFINAQLEQVANEAQDINVKIA